MLGVKIADHNVALLQYHELHPEVSNRRLGELSGITKQRVGHIIKRDKRDRMVVEYFGTHPGASPAEVAAIFHISLQRARSLAQKISPSANAVHPTGALGVDLAVCEFYS